MATREKSNTTEAVDIKTIKMTRDESYPLPHSVDVHPDEIENYKTAGFVESK